MKVAISSSGQTLEAPTHSQFGRCDYFVIVDAETNTSTAVKNVSAAAATGAGTAAAQELLAAGVEAVVSGQIGPNAYDTLHAAGIAIYLAPPGISCRQALDRLTAGSLSEMRVQRF